MLERDAPEDLETAKAVLETLNLLCEVDEAQEGKVCLLPPYHTIMDG
jgi:hypothetical protein